MHSFWRSPARTLFYHCESEERSDGKSSTQNDGEAIMISDFIRHLTQNRPSHEQIKPSEITVLTPYTAQKNELQKLMGLCGVTVQTITAYQVKLNILEFLHQC